MKKILVGFIAIGLFTFIGCAEETDIRKEKKNEVLNKIEVDSCVARVSSYLRMKKIFLHLSFKVKGDIDSLLYLKLKISMVDKYDKKWFDEEVMIKDIDCNLNQVCNVSYQIPWESNNHSYTSSQFGNSVNAFNLVLMNADNFKYFRKDSLYKGNVVNYITNGATGYDRILIPDAKFEIIGYK